MIAKGRIGWFLYFALLAGGACAAPEGAPAPSNPPPDGGQSDVYGRLADGDGIYVGTIEEVRPERTRLHNDYGAPLIEEEGELRFAVERTLFGEGVAELRTHYVCDQPYHVVASDWGGHNWDEHPPKRGLRLALLVYGKKNRERFAEGIKEEGLATYIWDAPRGSPFVEELAEACGLLTATEVKDRTRLVKDLAGSKYPTIRWFVLDAVLGKGELGRPAPDSPPELVLEYLRASGSTAPEPFSRGYITEGLVTWFSDEGRVDSAGEDLRTAFEAWYTVELNALGQDGSRDVHTLGCLYELCKKLGVSRALELFKHTGRDGLIKRVTDYQKTTDWGARDQAQDLLDLLMEK